MEGPRSQAYALYVAGVLCVVQAFSIVDRYIISVCLEPLRHDLHLSDTQLGILMGPSFVLLFALASLPLGRLADSVSSRMMVLASLVFWSGACFMSGLAHDFPQLLVTRLLIGLGEAALMPAAMRLIGAYFPGGGVNRGASIYGAGNSLGRSIAFLAGGALLTVFTRWGSVHLPLLAPLKPWQALFVVSALAGFGLCVFVLTIKEPPAPAARDAGSSAREAIRYLWSRRGAYLPLFVAFSMINLGVQVLASWTVSFLVREHGVAVGAASTLLGLCSLVAGPGGALIGGWMTERLQARGVAAPHMLMMTVSLVAMLVFGAGFWLAPTAVLASLAYVGLYAGASLSAAPGFGGTLRLTPARYRGVISSLFLCTYVLIGAGLGPLIVGLLSDLALPSLGASIFAAILIAAVVGIPLTLTGRRAFEDAVAGKAAPGAVDAPRMAAPAAKAASLSEL